MEDPRTDSDYSGLPYYTTGTVATFSSQVYLGGVGGTAVLSDGSAYSTPVFLTWTSGPFVAPTSASMGLLIPVQSHDAGYMLLPPPIHLYSTPPAMPPPTLLVPTSMQPPSPTSQQPSVLPPSHPYPLSSRDTLTAMAGNDNLTPNRFADMVTTAYGYGGPEQSEESIPWASRAQTVMAQVYDSTLEVLETDPQASLSSAIVGSMRRAIGEGQEGTVRPTLADRHLLAEMNIDLWCANLQERVRWRAPSPPGSVISR